jgi:hypothetical protein
MKLVSKALAVAIATIGFGAEAHAATVLTGNNPSITVGGSYILGNAATSITITASDVLLDLGGYTVGNWYSCAMINNGQSPGCSGTGQGTSPAIKATGSNVMIQNGRVEGAYGDGIVASPASLGAFLSIVIKDVTVDNNQGHGIILNGNGAQLTNVQSYQNSQDGILLQDNVRLEHVTTSYNNGAGVNGTAGSGNYLDISTSRNKGNGIVANGNLSKIDAKSNASPGIVASGVLRDSNSEYNTGDGVVANQHGVVIDTVSFQNSGNGFTLGTSSCYTGLSANGNTGTGVSGGTALTGSTASCN